MSQSVEAVRKIFTDFRPWTLYNGGITSMGLDIANLTVLFGAVILQIFVSLTEHKGISVAGTVEQMHVFARWPLYLMLLFSVLVFGIYGPGFEASQFIYFQF